MNRYEEKVTWREDGSVVLRCESGNPLLGVVLTPTAGDGLIASLANSMRGEDVHPCDMVAVHLGPEQCAAMDEVASRVMGE